MRQNELFEQTRSAAYEIIERENSTHYAIAAGLVRVVEAIVRDQRSVLRCRAFSTMPTASTACA